MPFKFRTKSECDNSTLIDALRILAWTQFKQFELGKIKGGKDRPASEIYNDFFAPEWEKQKDELITMTERELYTFVQSIEYDVDDLLKARNAYYDRKKTWQKENYSPDTKDEIENGNDPVPF